MAGPVASVLFATAAAPSWRATLDEVIDLVGSKGEGDSIWVETTRPIGGSYEGLGRHFLADVIDDSDRPWAEGAWPAEIEETPAGFFERTFGLVPDEGITLAAMPNNPEDHRILGELAICVAERLGGIIDMCGLIVPRGLPFKEWRGAPWSVVRARVEAFTASMPGKAVAIPYQTGSREWASHKVDSEFLCAWMRHLEFRMIK